MNPDPARVTGTMPGVSRSAALAVLVPAIGATLIVLAFVVMEIAGREPLSYGSPKNIAEAAGMGISAEVLRFLRDGQDPADVYPVRPEIISSSIRYATAFEAAIWGRNGRLLRLLDREGVLSEPEVRRHMTCLAVHLDAEDLLAYLAPDGVTGCDPDATIALIEGRSR